jgi:GcrA cell cycle regulator
MDENNNQIKDLWLEGLTGSQIAKKLGVTRNSVMGKLHRMRHSGALAGKALKQRMKSIKTAISKKELEIRKSDPGSAFDVWIPRPVPVEKYLSIIVCEDVPPKPVGKPIQFDKLTSKSCRFVVNSGNPRDFLFCGNPKKGRSYCDEHEKICYYRPIKKDEEVS